LNNRLKTDPIKANKSKVVWFTGLSGSGKSTLSEMLISHLKKRGENLLILDGDKIRSTVHNDFDFSPEKIKKNSNLIINLCKENIPFHDYIIVSVIAPFEETRKYARKLLGNCYIEIYVKASMKELVKRDTKGLYKKAINGELENLIGVDPNTPYQIPENSNLIIDTDIQTEGQSFKKILDFMI
jgi:adenylyl-sulfate kinase